MKYPLAIFTAAAATVAGILRIVVGDATDPIPMDLDEASPIPRLTAKAVEKLAFAGGSDADIADRFLVDESFIRREYADVLRAARAVRRFTVRGLQLDLARKLNDPMLLWLGRNELNQSLAPSKLGEPEPEFPAD